MPGCAYGLRLMAGPPCFPIEAVVVMSAGFPTRLDPSAFCVVLVGVAVGLTTRGVPLFPWSFHMRYICFFLRRHISSKFKVSL